MSDLAAEDILGESLSPPEDKPKKGQRAKKRPSDFEITRTILQRTHERKLPILLQNMGADKDLLFLCSAEEEGFLYGSSEMAIALVKFDNDEVKDLVTGVLSKLEGYGTDQSLLINIRDQLSELAKTKGESLDIELERNPDGTSWFTRQDARGTERTVYYTKAFESLFHFEAVKYWCDHYRPLLERDDPSVIYYPYTHPAGDTYSILSIDKDHCQDHALSAYYPDGFRICVTRGIDMLITKGFEPHWPYQVQKEEILLFLKDGATCQMAHRIIGDGWRMLLVRPNSVMFPVKGVNLQTIGHNGL